MRISDWSSDVCSSDLAGLLAPDYLAARSALIDPGTSIERPGPGHPAGASRALADGDEPEENGTSHFAAIDGEGTMEIGRASCRERVCQYVEISWVAGSLKTKKMQTTRQKYKQN